MSLYKIVTLNVDLCICKLYDLVPRTLSANSLLRVHGCGVGEPPLQVPANDLRLVKLRVNLRRRRMLMRLPMMMLLAVSHVGRMRRRRRPRR